MDTVFCRTTAKGIQTFYVKANNIEYFLFSQAFRSSVKKHFENGVSLRDCSNYSSSKSFSVRKTLDKLKVYLPYVEKEYGIALYEKTKKKQSYKVGGAL